MFFIDFQYIVNRFRDYQLNARINIRDNLCVSLNLLACTRSIRALHPFLNDALASLKKHNRTYHRAHDGQRLKKG